VFVCVYCCLSALIIGLSAVHHSVTLVKLRNNSFSSSQLTIRFAKALHKIK